MKLFPSLIFFIFLQCLSAQIQERVDFIRGEVWVEPLTGEKAIKGRVVYDFVVREKVDSLFLDAHKMAFSTVLLDGRPAAYRVGPDKIVIDGDFGQGDSHRLELGYLAHPAQTVYFLGWEDADPGMGQIWTQGQGKYTSHWLPSFDDMTEKVEFDLTLTFDRRYRVAANGILIRREDHGDRISWTFDMQRPMSSYLLAFAIGKYDKKTISSTSGIPLELYHYPRDSSKVEPTYRHTRRIFDFLEREIGVDYPWGVYRQLPVRDFLYAGMENTGCTLFSDQFMVDSIAFVDKNYVNVNAHEMAHHWFGNLVTESSAEHHWLHEGFATYYAYLAERDIFGEDHFYWHLLETAEALERFSEDGLGEALENPAAGSLTFYEKGAWALVVLRERVGDAHFREGTRNYLQKHAYQNVGIPDYLTEIEKVSDMDLSTFKEQWLISADFHFGRALDYLKEKSGSIRRYFQLKEEIGKHVENSGELLEGAWAGLESSRLKQRLITDYGKQFSSSFKAVILKTGDLGQRRAIVQGMDGIPQDLVQGVEGLLGDPSYANIETALYKLWSSHPRHRARYLDRTKGVVGFPNKNIRLLWLLLAVATEGYEPGSKALYFEELSSYTGPENHFETRLLAFQYLKAVGGFGDRELVNLLDACNHHVWHFKKSARNILDGILRQEEGPARLKSLYPLLNQQERQYLDKTLGE